MSVASRTSCWSIKQGRAGFTLNMPRIMLAKWKQMAGWTWCLPWELGRSSIKSRLLDGRRPLSSRGTVQPGGWVKFFCYLTCKYIKQFTYYNLFKGKRTSSGKKTIPCCSTYHSTRSPFFFINIIKLSILNQSLCQTQAGMFCVKDRSIQFNIMAGTIGTQSLSTEGLTELNCLYKVLPFITSLFVVDCVLLNLKL